MNMELLEVQPEELRFTFELKKQSSCSIRLTNQSDHHVAFKIKTNSSSKYCVRPNTGVIKPNLTCDLSVTMQAQEIATPDFICTDKFLIQSTIVPKGIKEEHITFATFAKEDGKYIEEKKLKVILVSPPVSPVLSPMNGISRTRPYNAATESNHDLVQNHTSHAMIDEDIRSDREQIKNKKSINRKHTDELRLSNDVEEMKSKLREFESILRQDNLRTNQNTGTGVTGFQLLFVFVVAVASLYLGYTLNRS